MKNLKLPQIRFWITLCFLLLFNLNQGSTQVLEPSDAAPLFFHLQEINKEWLNYKKEFTSSTDQVAFNKDEERIQLHLQLVHQILSAKNTNHLNEAQQTNRKQLLDVLAEYAQLAIFPKNIHHQKRQPYFVDHLNNACAVGYLLQQNGQTDLVNQIKKEKNYAYIDELVKAYPTINKWADDNGFTTSELAWIQPGYPPRPTNWHAVGNDGGIEGQINVMISDHDDEFLYMAGDFTAVDGVPANSIIAWDGYSWHTLGEGVNGEIHAMHVAPNGLLYIAGNFELNSNPNYTNVAVWDGDSWTGLQQGDMEGTVFDIYVSYRIYIGGDFKKVNGMDMPYLAKKEIGSGSWNNEVAYYDFANRQYDTIPNAFSVDNAVYSFTEVDGRLLVAGAFKTTAPEANSNNINSFPTDYLAYWNMRDNWEVGISGNHPPVSKVEHINSKLYLSGFDNSYYTVSIFYLGLWGTWLLTPIDTNVTTPLVLGFFEMEERIFAYGNIKNQPFVGTFSDGIADITFENPSNSITDGAKFDKPVRAAEVFQDHVYFAGDFTTSNGANQFNGLTYSSLSLFTSVDNNDAASFDIYSHNKQLYIDYDNFNQETQLRVYDTQGILVWSTSLGSGSGNLQEDLSRLRDGIFVYEMINGKQRSTGKLSMF